VVLEDRDQHRRRRRRRRLRQRQSRLTQMPKRAVAPLLRAPVALVARCLDRVARSVMMNCRPRWEQADAESCNEKR